MAQNGAELRVAVTDSAGLPVTASGQLLSGSNHVRKSFTTTADGRFTFKDLAFGVYRLEIRQPGFAAAGQAVELRSALPVTVPIVLRVAPVQTTLVISDTETLVDTAQTGSEYHAGSETLRYRKAALPGRSVLDLIDQQPGWLLEANGVLHPRGSEYDTQYVVDGMPITENRSPAFAPELDADDIQSMNVLLSSYPAEYGRKLGGVIEVTTERDTRPGLHGKVSGGGGSFNTESGFGALQYGWKKEWLQVHAVAAHTDRYLDPPVEENYTNRASTGGGGSRFEWDPNERDRIQASVRHEATRFLVPDERVQYAAGQRQDRETLETAGQISYQHIFAPNLLGDARLSVRDVASNLWSNPLATPVDVEQARSFREIYLKISVSALLRHHDLKFGAEGTFGSIAEAFAYAITGPGQFDPETAAAFRFVGRHDSREQAAFAQDTMRWGDLTVSAGLRWDHYRLLVSDNAFSPRLGVAWLWRATGLVLRASYDRAFQTPAIENLLLASAGELATVSDQVLRLPVRPSRGDFFDAGFTRALFGHVRVSADVYRRNLRDFADDDVLLNTGVSIPISFQSAAIHGEDIKLEISDWGRWSGYLSYSNMNGTGRLPVTGGLFLGEDAAAALGGRATFPISQDQRNTVHGRVRVQLPGRLWFAPAASYGSGLPVEFSGDPADVAEAYGPRILRRVNFAHERVRPSFSADMSLGWELLRRQERTLRLQADILNVTNRLNVINFAGLFSGTAIAAPRSFSLRLSTDF